MLARLLAQANSSPVIHLFETAPAQLCSVVDTCIRCWKTAIFALSGWLAIGTSTAQTEPERLIEAGHWKRARGLVEARMQAGPKDPLANFLLSQIRNAFGDRESPLALAEAAVAAGGGVAKYHRQLAEVLGVKAQHSGLLQQLVLARRFKKEIDTAIALDPHDIQALRDLMEFYLLAPGIAGGDKAKARISAGQIAGINPAEGFSAQARLAEFQGDHNHVEEFLRQAVGAGPANYKARIALANFYYTHKNPEAAERQAKGTAGRARILTGCAHSWVDGCFHGAFPL